MTESFARSPKPRRRGFTLLEVLGAVAILGISYVMLATASIQGLRAVGESQRRLEASLLADRILTELEIGTETGQLLEPRLETWESEPFEIELEILDLAEIYQGKVENEKSGDLLAFLGEEANGPFAPFRETNLLLGYLREVHIHVRWFEFGNEREVARTAYLYDQQAWIENEQSAAQAEQAELEGQEQLDDGSLPQGIQDQIRSQLGTEAR